MPLFCVIGGRLCPYSLVMEVGQASILGDGGRSCFKFLCDGGRSCLYSL